MKKKLSPALRVLLACVAQHSNGITRPDISKILTKGPNVLNRQLRTLEAEGLVHVGAWEYPPTGRPLPVWLAGPGAAASRERPPPKMIRNESLNTARAKQRRDGRLNRFQNIQHRFKTVFAAGINPWPQAPVDSAAGCQQ